MCMRMAVGIVCPAAIQRVVSMKQDAYKKEFEEIIKPFLLEKSYISKEDFDKRLKIVADRVWRRFQRCAYRDAISKTMKITGVDWDDWASSCTGEASLGVLNALRNMPPMEIGQFTVYIRKAISQSVANELTKLYGYTQNRAVFDERFHYHPQETTDRQVEHQRLFELIYERLKSIPEEDKLLLDKHCEQSMSLREIGRDLYLSPEAVRLNLARVYDKVKHLFTAQEQEDIEDMQKEMSGC